MAVIGLLLFESVVRDHSKDHPMTVAYVSATRSPGSVHHSAGRNCRLLGSTQTTGVEMPRRYWSFWWAGLGVALMLNVISAFASAAATRTLLLIGAVAWFAAIERGLKSPRVPRPKPFSFYWSAIVFALDVASSALQLTAATNDVLAVVFVVVFATELGFFVVGGLVVVAMWAARRGTSVPVPVPEAVPHAVRGPAATTTTADVEPTKRCPYCGEEILAVARKCKHCGEFLDGTTTGSR